MNLSKDQEEALVKKYDRLVWSTVHRFKRRNNSELNNYEDLYQECMLVLFNSIRKAPTLDGFRPPIRDMVHAMCEYTLGEQVAKVPIRTSDYSRRIEKVAKSVPYENIDLSEEIRSDATEGILCSTLFSAFLASLTGQDAKIIRMKLHGSRNREVAKALGTTDLIICRSLKRLRLQYAAFAA